MKQIKDAIKVEKRHKWRQEANRLSAVILLYFIVDKMVILLVMDVLRQMEQQRKQELANQLALDVATHFDDAVQFDQLQNKNEWMKQNRK